MFIREPSQPQIMKVREIMATRIRYPINVKVPDPEQQMVIDWDYGPVVVSASAGSGKSFSVVERIARLIKDGVKPSTIFATTFTKKAAEEMVDRLKTKGIDGANVRTMHSYCWSLIREHRKFAGFEIDGKDAATIVLNQIIGFQDMKWKGVDITLVEKFIGECRNALIKPEESSTFKIEDYEERYAEAYWKFSEAMFKRRLITFDDMLYYGVQLLKEDNRLLAQEQGKYEFVIVDEYQDSNVAQVELAELVAYPENNLMVVGDVDQCHPWFVSINTPNGSCVVRDIKVGDLVTSLDFQTFQSVPRRVTRIGRREYNGPLIRIYADEQNVEVTPEHRVPTSDGKEVQAKNLSSSRHRVFVDNDNSNAWQNVSYVEETHTRDFPAHDGYVYSLEVEGLHNYFADGILVHNCIYEFRGAVPQYMLDFQKRTGGTLLELNNNYRCPPEVIYRASDVIGHNEKRFSKQVVAAKKCDNKITYFVAQDQDDEALRVSEYIKQLVTDGLSYAQVFILMRTNAQSRAFEEAFVFSGIPFVILGGVSFYERKEVQDLLAYIKVLLDPMDVTAGLKSISRPFRFIKKEHLDRACQYVNGDTGLGFVGAIEYYTRQKVSSSGMDDYVRLMDSLDVTASPSSILLKVVEKTGWKDRLVQEDGSDSTENNRGDNIDALIGSAARFRSCKQFLDYVNRQIRLRRADARNKDTNRVQVSTVHKQKGCQSKAVFVIGINDGLFPHSKTTNVEEERRLFFVAMTRAEEHLFCSSIRTNNGRESIISKFVVEAKLTPSDDSDSVDALAFPEGVSTDYEDVEGV